MSISKIQRKKFRVRNKIKKVSSNDRYRLCVSRSAKNISAQIIDDVRKITLVSASSNTKEIKSQKKNKKELSTIVAENLAKKAKDIKITKVYFDRGIYKYHTIDKIPDNKVSKYTWQKKHLENQTGTSNSFKPVKIGKKNIKKKYETWK